MSAATIAQKVPPSSTRARQAMTLPLKVLMSRARKLARATEKSGSVTMMTEITAQ